MSTCGKCGAELKESARFCKSCGKPVAAQKLCPSCGHKNDPDAKFCDHCGKPLE